MILFLAVVLSHTARPQIASPNPACYGQPIYLFCNLSGCEVPGATYTWTNTSGSWTSNLQTPQIDPGTVGYATDRFYVSVEFEPPPTGYSSGSVFVNLLPELNITGSVSNVMCFGSSTGMISLSATGGLPPYSYLWCNGGTTGNQAGLCAGSYTVTVSDFTQCQRIENYVISGPATGSGIAGSAEVTDVACNGEWNGAINLTVVGGTPPNNYIWSNGATTKDLAGVPAGTYSVTITDANNCMRVDSWLVSQPPNLLWEGSVTNNSCFGDSNGMIAGATSGGTPPYSYLWSNGKTTQSLDGLGAGIYFLTVTDTKGCDFRTLRRITQPQILSLLSETVVPASCMGKDDGSIDISVAGGITPYSYLWSTGASTPGIQHLVAGDYTITITDAHSCTKTAAYTISQTEVMCQRILQDYNILPESFQCLDAVELITIAGEGKVFTVQNGGTVVLIAGQRINFLPGSVIHSGGYLHGYITTDGTYCSGTKDELVAGSEDGSPVFEDNSGPTPMPVFSVYPNPTTGIFTLELPHGYQSEPVHLKIRGMHGDQILSRELFGEKKYMITLPNAPPGLYFIHVVTPWSSDILKIIKI